MLATLTGLGAGFLAIAGYAFEIESVATVGKILFLICWAIAAIMWLRFVASSAKGKYKNVSDRAWRDQIW